MTLASAVAVSAAAPVLYAQLRVAVVDMQRAVRETDEGLRAASQLKAIFDVRQRELDRRTDSLRRMHDDLDRQRSVLSADAYGRMQSDYTQQLANLQSDFQAYQQDLQRREQELTKQIYTNLERVVSDVRAQDNLDVVVDRSGVVFTARQLDDMTDRVVRAYNQAYPARDGGVAAPAAGRAATTPTPAPTPGAQPGSRGGR